MNVGVFFRIITIHPINNDLRLLTGRGAVQVNEPWMSGEYGKFCSQNAASSV
jgi:hypothetical protein